MMTIVFNYHHQHYAHIIINVYCFLFFNFIIIGLSAPRVSKNGQPLPPPRVVSFILHQADENDYDTEVTYLVIAWGQMVDHDLTFASMPKGLSFKH